MPQNKIYVKVFIKKKLNYSKIFIFITKKEREREKDRKKRCDSMDMALGKLYLM